MEALADVLTFATGRIMSLEKKSIGDYAGSTKVLATNVGVIGWSTGGNLATLTMARHGEQFRDLAWYTSWESPVLFQTLVREAFTKRIDSTIRPQAESITDGYGTVLKCRCGSGRLRDFGRTRVGHAAVCISMVTVMAPSIEMRTMHSGSDIGH